MDRMSDRTIMVVDDTEANLDILVDVLGEDYDVAVAMDGKTALEDIEANPPDLILLDIMMPGIDGYEVCRRLKDNEATRDIPVIFVTAKSEVEDETKGFEVGGVDYITKPISPPVVLARVKTHLALMQARLTLEKQNRELIEAARLREDVANIMRHDLKGPLTVIIGMPGLMLMEPDVKPDQIPSLKSIEDAGYKMLNMINLSLDLLKMERGVYELTPQPVNLVSIFFKLFEELGTLARHKNLKMELVLGDRPVRQEDGFLVMVEELLTFSLFSNLIKNAVEASPENGPVRVALDRGSDMNRVSIFNHGTVPEEIRDRFFDKYVTAGKKGGTGLGTYSARLMAETLKGSIHLESSVEEGTTITVLLPPATIETAERTASNTRSVSSGDMIDLPAKCVLVVDDDPHSRELIVRFLDHPSLTVETAENGRQALDRMTSQNYDLIFMDAEMPVMDGFEAASRFRVWEAENRSQPIPVIALTGHDSQAVLQKLLDAGFTNHLTKPVTAADLHSAIRNPAEVRSGGADAKTAMEEDQGDIVRVDADFEGMVEGFIDDNRKAMTDMPGALDHGDFETIRRFGHTLAGTGRMYGLIRLGKMGSALEDAAKEERAGDVRSLLSELDAYMNRIRIEYVEEE